MAVLKNTIGVPFDQQSSILQQVATKYGIPIEILIGVYGIETTWGTNTTTSSAGAIGPFQFIPSTARQYAYPLTNNPTPRQFAQQADATGHYLSDLYHQSHSWDTALQHYSGGGYGLSKVQDMWKQAGGIFPGISHPSDAKPGVGTAAGFVAAIPGAAASTIAGGLLGAGVAADIWNWLTTPAKWLIILKFAGGALLLFWGLKELTGANVPTVRVA